MVWVDVMPVTSKRNSNERTGGGVLFMGDSKLELRFDLFKFQVTIDTQDKNVTKTV